MTASPYGPQIGPGSQRGEESHDSDRGLSLSSGQTGEAQEGRSGGICNLDSCCKMAAG